MKVAFVLTTGLVSPYDKIERIKNSCGVTKININLLSVAFFENDYSIVVEGNEVDIDIFVKILKELGTVKKL